MEALRYRFSVVAEGNEIPLGSAQTKYLSSEVASGFTGVVAGLYAVGDNRAKFNDYVSRYTSEEIEGV